MTRPPIHRCKKGATLVELAIVLVLFSILSVMITSFSAVTETFAADAQSRYAFLDECATLRHEISEFVAACDDSGRKITVNETMLIFAEGVDPRNKVLWITKNELHIASTVDGSDPVHVFSGIDTVKFGIVDVGNDKLLKCTATGSDSKGREYEQSFAFALRAGRFTGEMLND